MSRYVGLLIASTLAAGLMAACSAAPDTSGSLAGGTQGHSTAGNGQTGSGSGSGSTGGTGGDNTGGSTGNGDTAGGNNSGGATTPPAGNTPPVATPPPSGPGSTSSAAHQYFVATVYPALNNCAACHGTGANGAPKMLDADPNIAYSSLDSLGLIQQNSMLLTKGAHAGGAAPALSATQQQVVTTWLGMESTERAGQAAPVNVLQKLASCMDKTAFQAIGLQTLVTVQRNGENANRCTGCNKAVCSSCHGDTQTSFYEQIGSKLGDNTFEMTQQQPYILKYFGLNGSTPVASNGLKLKMQAVNAAAPYSHPNFVIPATVQANLDKFVSDTIAKYTAGTCTAAAAPDAGP